jgi:hypothetical protein
MFDDVKHEVINAGGGPGDEKNASGLLPIEAVEDHQDGTEY